MPYTQRRCGIHGGMVYRVDGCLNSICLGNRMANAIATHDGQTLTGHMAWDEVHDVLEIVTIWVNPAHPRALLEMMTKLRAEKPGRMIRYTCAVDNEAMQRLSGLLGADLVGNIWQYRLPGETP